VVQQSRGGGIASEFTRALENFAKALEGDTRDTA